ncbi:MAG: iron-sulfur cluster assembly scaffold protein [Desulfarculaceae bacterium]|nr:iron-sulfur cluster assembly scaffold protein [Desulfarculaceae bacterium]
MATPPTDPENAAQDQGPALPEAFWNHGLTPSYVGLISQPEGYARRATDCGDAIELFLRIRGGVLSDARCLAEGCLHTVACASALATLARGKDLKQAAALGPEEISRELGGLDAAHMHCAEMAVEVLREALRDACAKRQTPWQAPYQRR